MTFSLWFTPMRLVVGLLLLAVSVTSHATLLTWSLDNITYSDGAIATGSFEFDVDVWTSSGGTAGLGNFHITFSAGSTPELTAFEYDQALSYQLTTASPDRVQLVTNVELNNDPQHVRSFDLQLGSPMTNNGGILPLFLVSSEGFSNGGPTHTVIEGSISSFPVPEPAVATLFVIGLALLGGLYFRKP